MLIAGAILPALLVATRSAAPQAPRINVGANVQVSADGPRLAHNEILGEAHPVNARRMLVCAQIVDPTMNQANAALYLTRNGGASWKRTLQTIDSTAFTTGDQVCGFGRGDTALMIVYGPWKPGPSDPSGQRMVGQNTIFRSRDGGETWPDTSTMRSIARPFLAVDRRGKYAGRIYLNSAGGGCTIDRSVDGGRTFLEPTRRKVTPPRSNLPNGPGVVMSDGTFGFITVIMNDSLGGAASWKVSPEKANGKIEFCTSRNGGETIDTSIVVSEAWMDMYPWKPLTTSIVPALAVDASSPHFRDRLYAAWSDRRTGRNQIVLSYSADAGKHWSEPRVISDDRPTPRGVVAPDNFMPAVAVNRDGVVAVSWLDRRENPNNIGWYPRLTVSLDGGETWLRSVRLSDSAADPANPHRWLPSAGSRTIAGTGMIIDISLQFWTFGAGDTGALLVDANGVFHPMWIDDRTGFAQIWTAPVTVNGSVHPNGSAALADLVDRSSSVRAVIRDVAVNPDRHEFTFSLRLLNASRDTLRAPLWLRVASITSPIGDPKILTSDASDDQAVSLLDFTRLVPNGALAPGGTTMSRRVVVRVDNMRPLGPPSPGERFLSTDSRMVELRARVLSKR